MHTIPNFREKSLIEKSVIKHDLYDPLVPLQKTHTIVTKCLGILALSMNPAFPKINEWNWIWAK